MTQRIMSVLFVTGVMLAARWPVMPAVAEEAAPAAAAPQEDTRTRAISQLLESTRSTDPFRRANAVEAVQAVPDRAVPVVQLALDDPHPVVRFSSLVVVGRMKLASLVSQAEKKLSDPQPSVRAAAMFAVRANGREVDLSPMAAMLASQNPGLRSNVVMLMGMLKDKSAIPMIREMAQMPMPRASPAAAAIARFQASEALAVLGDDTVIAALRAGPYSQYDELRVLAIQSLGRVNDRAMTSAIKDLLANPTVEVQLAAAESLGRFGLPDGLPVALAASASPVGTVRTQAAMVLGLFDDTRAKAALQRLLVDADEQTRLSASAAILGYSRISAR